MKVTGLLVQITTMAKIFFDYLYTILNIGIIVCTFVESYLFPFAVVQWMIIVTKYSGLLPTLRRCNNVTQARNLRKRYRYTLELMTCRNAIQSSKSQNRVSYLSFVMEDDSVSKKWLQLSYCGQDCQRIPPALWNMYGATVHYLDLSYNNIETLKGLEQFDRLEELILDNNKLGDSVAFPHLACLRTLSLNNNQITDLDSLIYKIIDHFPALSYLSLLSNKACPDQLSDIDKDDSDYQRYRYFVIYKLRNLKFLDSRRVSDTERTEADTRGEFTRVRRPQTHPERAHIPSATMANTGHTARPLPVDLAALGKHRGAYGKCHYRYTGKHSEGNRFIVNSDL